MLLGLVVVSFSRRRRSRATRFSRVVRYGAEPGVSGIMDHASVATMTDGKPSMRKRRRQGAMGPYSPNLRMTQAREDANVVASGAAADRIV